VVFLLTDGAADPYDLLYWRDDFDDCFASSPNELGRAKQIVAQGRRVSDSEPALDAETTGITSNHPQVSGGLVTPDERCNLPAPIEPLFVAGHRPMIARQITYFEEREFKGAFDPA
jgi:type IV secretory pathway TraG/TraD family ATPase VirD4